MYGSESVETTPKGRNRDRDKTHEQIFRGGRDMYNVQTKGGREKEVLRENGGTEEEERERERSYDGS